MSYRIAIIAGEVSGDMLGGDLIAALKNRTPQPLELIGVGGESLQAQGLTSLFDYSELSIMGVTQVLAKLPKLLSRIRETADAIIRARPDVLIIIDSPDFTHRVARRVRKALPDLPVIDYVCPSVWAWKEYRAKAMLAYVDHVLAILPFEPEVMRRLGGPQTSFVGHCLTADADILEVRRRRALMEGKADGAPRRIVLLPGSRAGEIRALLPVMLETMAMLRARGGAYEFILPTVPRREALLREMLAGVENPPRLVAGHKEKWAAFAEADAALAASGTVILELGLAGVPTVSIYKVDWLMRFFRNRLKIWSAALPNLIADYPIVPEYFDEMMRAGRLARWLERLSAGTTERQAALEGFETLWRKLSTPVAPGEESARIVLSYLEKKQAGSP